MTGFFHKIRQYFNGTGVLNIKTKYTMICLGLGVIHVVFMCVFAATRISPLFWYNVFATVFYLFVSFVLIPMKKNFLGILLVYIEILGCASYSSLMLGWNWGFGMYTLSMVPATYYLAYTLPDIRRKIAVPTAMSGGIGVCYILTRVVCGRIDPLYKGEINPANTQISLYYFNIIIAFLVLLIFSTMFAMEILYMQKQLEVENIFLGEIANIDSLTHLLNRRSMNAQLKQAYESAMAKEEPFCIIMLDIDDFKHVNDTYGHDCGDEVLISLAQVVSQTVRNEDAVCRWGGEEILVMIHGNLEEAQNMAEHICRNVREHEVTYKERTVKVTLTVGISGYRKGLTLRDMIVEADENMYYGKQHGKNQVVAPKEEI